MKKYSFLSVLMIFVLCLSLVLTGCGKAAGSDETTKPVEELTMELAINNTVNALCVSDCPAAVLKDMNTKKVVTISKDDLFTNVLNLDIANKSFYDELDLTVEGQTLNVNVYCDGKDLAFTAPELMGGDMALGVNFSTFMEDLIASGLLEGMESEMGISVPMLQSAISQYMELAEDLEGEANEKVQKALEKALEDTEKTEEEGTVNVYGEDVDAKIFTYAMDKEDFLNLIDAMFEIAEDTYGQFMQTMVDSEMVDEELMEENPYTAIREEMAETFKEVELDCTVRFAVNKENRCIMLMDSTVKTTAEGETVDGIIELVLGKDPAASDKFTLTMDFGADDGSELNAELTLSNTTEGTVDTTTVVFEGDMDGETASANFTATYDNSTNSYELALDLADDHYAARGQMDSTDTKLTLTIDEVEGEGETLPLGLTISIEEGPDCEIPAVPEYTNILTDMDLAGMLGMGSTDYPEDWTDEDWSDEEWIETTELEPEI